MQALFIRDWKSKPRLPSMIELALPKECGRGQHRAMGSVADLCTTRKQARLTQVKQPSETRDKMGSVHILPDRTTESGSCMAILWHASSFASTMQKNQPEPFILPPTRQSNPLKTRSNHNYSSASRKSYPAASSLAPTSE